MLGLDEPYAVLRGVLDPNDIDALISACRARLESDGIPCYAMIDRRQDPTYEKIRSAAQSRVGLRLNYLNDFYIYTDNASRAGWHIDTELFTFEHAVNAWILLSPDRVDEPLAFIPDVNDDPSRYFHSVSFDGDVGRFRNYRTRTSCTRSLQDIELVQCAAPDISIGDILLINPRFFHRTNVDTPKHAFAMKFVYGDHEGCLSSEQVPSVLWPEVKTFNEIVGQSTCWEDVVRGLREQLATDEGRKRLSSGFYPEQFGLYETMIRTLGDPAPRASE